jgi:hypothetical protein
MCVVLGAGVKKHQGSGVVREQIDLAPTIAAMLGFSMKTATGKVMEEILLSP